ncbi:MAG: pilus assembly protein [Ornithinimicrobium sp.]
MRWQSDRGSMLVEVLFLMVLLMLPLFYLVGTLGRLQAGAYAASAAARETGRAYGTADSEAQAPARGAAAADLVFEAHGFGAGEGSVSVTCRSVPCLTPGARISVTSEVLVDIPLIPDFLAGAVPTTVSMTSFHVESIDAFREG